MTFRKKKPDYDHIARLERELADMDMLGPEIEEALNAKRSKRKEFFTPPILKKNTYEQPYWQFANGQTAAYSMSAHPHHADSTNFVQILHSRGLVNSGLAKQIVIARG